jgi:hypothetical protein
MVIADYLRSCGYRVIEAASATRTAQFAAGLGSTLLVLVMRGAAWRGQLKPM